MVIMIKIYKKISNVVKHVNYW